MSTPNNASAIPTTRLSFSATASVNARGQFEILAITAGRSIVRDEAGAMMPDKGWIFPASVLQMSVPLWNGVSCFVDHTEEMGASRQLRHLGGVLSSPSWDAASQGVRAVLSTRGAMGNLVDELGRQVLLDISPTDAPTVGFSGDILFTSEGDEVRKILKVFFLDLVFDPARGGAFVRALNSVASGKNAAGQKEAEMPNKQDPAVTTAIEEVVVEPTAAASSDVEAVRALLAVTKEKKALADEAQKALEVRKQMNVYLLDAGLASSGLPEPMQGHVRAQFQGKVFEPSELTAAIDAARKLLSELDGPSVIQGPQRVRFIADSRDQIQAAMDDLLGAEREKGQENTVVHRLRGIREAYMMFTGDHDLHGGYYPDRAQLQSTTATFAGVVKNALNKVLVRHWDQLGVAGWDWWKHIATVEHFDTLNSVTWVIFGTVGSLPTIAEGAEYTELAIVDQPETSTFTKYGGYIGLTLEAIDRDNIQALKRIPKELAGGAIRNISSLVAAVFSAAAGAGPTMADGGAVFNNTAVTTTGGHANLLTTALGTDYIAWAVVAKAMYNQPMLQNTGTGLVGLGSKLALDPKFCLVPRALKDAAEALFIPRWSQVNTVQVVPTSGGQTYGGAVMPIVVPDWTDATDWAAVADPLLVPGVMIAERFGIRPEIFVAGNDNDPAVFMNDESRLKVRHFLAVGVADYRPLANNHVA